MAPSDEYKGTTYNPDANDYGQPARSRLRPSYLGPKEADLPATDAHAADPVETTPPAPPEATPATAPAQDGPKDPEPPTVAPEAPTAAPEAAVAAYPENEATHPSRLPPAARPVRQGV